MPKLALDFLEHLTNVRGRLSYRINHPLWNVFDSHFSLYFEVNAAQFSILCIETYPSGKGTARKLLESIHAFADARDMRVIAQNVLLEAWSFWEHMGYSEKGDGLTYVRVK